ncbi:MAG: hypothetical protein J1G06_05410 [Oscillospiraceae bacterium]|nr:hypothetical protein [Oscillospiraceae bacterium]
MKHREIIDESLERHKRKRRKKRIIIFGTIFIVLFAALFTVYKIIMTPSRVVQLSLLNTGKEFIKSFEYVTSDESIGIIKDVLADGGTTDMSLKLEKSPVLRGIDADVRCVNDGTTAISEIKFNSLMKFTTYKDKEEFLVNIPLLSHGLQIPLTDFSEDYNNSIFKDKITIDQNSEGNKAIACAYAAIAAKGLVDANKDELIKWILSIEFDKTGKDKIKVGDKDKNAGVYTAQISKAKMEEFRRLASDYFNATDYSDSIKNTINSRLESFVDDYTVEVKVKMYQIREIDIISSDGTKRVIQLAGKSKPSYDIIYYKEGYQDEALRRTHTDSGSGSDKLSKNGNDLFAISKDGGKISVVTNYNGIDINLKAENISTLNNAAKMENISLTLNDNVTVSGDIVMSRSMEDSLTFERAESYINLLQADERGWQTIVDIVVSGLQLIKSRL